ncbi:hypothetical protein ACX0HA_04665 [Flavobacterium hauense]
MRNLDIIIKEIVELSEIKSAYNHYLSSYRSLTEVENTTQLQHNIRIIAQSINMLYTDLQRQKALEMRQVIPEKRQKAEVKPKNVTYSNEEKNAIIHFNRDRRFTITE